MLGAFLVLTYISRKQERQVVKMEGRNFTICGKSDFTDIRQFNLMFETKRGVTDDSASRIFLRPENAQGEYVNYLNVMRSMWAKLPFGIG